MNTNTDTLSDTPIEFEVTEAALEVLRCRQLLRGCQSIFARHHDPQTARHLRQAIREELVGSESDTEE